MTVVAGRNPAAPVAHWNRDPVVPEPRQARRIHTELAPQANARAVASPSSRPNESAIGQRLDAFLRQMKPAYRANGQAVQVASTFHSLHAMSDGAKNAALRAVRNELGKEKFGEIALSVRRAQSSRGTPEDIRVVTQALIDAGAVDKVLAKNPGLELRKAIQVVMVNFKIGLDCRGYVYRAFLHARGTGSLAASGSKYFDKDLGNVVFQNEHRLAASSLRQHARETSCA
jgi:hypothetical protein